MPELKIKPAGDRILVRHVEDKEQVRGVIMPDRAREKPQQAKVVAPGTASKVRGSGVMAFEVKAGDTVPVAKFAGSEVKLEDPRYTLVQEDDVPGIIG